MTARLVAPRCAVRGAARRGRRLPQPCGRGGADASVADVATYVARADVSRYWLGRSVGLLGMCCLLVFVAHVAARTAEAEGETRTLSRVLLAAGSAAGVLQFLAAPPQFAAVLAGDELVPGVSRGLLLSSGSFVLSFLPLGAFLGAAAVAGLRFRVLPPLACPRRRLDRDGAGGRHSRASAGPGGGGLPGLGPEPAVVRRREHRTNGPPRRAAGRLGDLVVARCDVVTRAPIV